MTETTKQVQFGELILAFTNQFVWEYNDKGSGAAQDGAFWRPTPPEGFSILGTFATSNYDDINQSGNSWSLCVKAAPQSKEPLKNPVDFEEIWNDHGSWGKHDGSCWRPIAPEGYVAMGDVMVSGYHKPDVTCVMCVRKDLTTGAVAGNQIWSDKKSGSKLSIDTFLLVPDPITDVSTTNGYFSANTFVANSKYAVPSDLPEMHVLNLPFPVSDAPDAPPPTLTSRNMPPNISGKTVDHITTVPFTAITDSGRTVAWQVANSPFYFLERTAYYQLEIFDDNTTSIDQPINKTVITGVSQSDSSTFSITTGVSVTAEAGVSFIAEGKVSATVSVELGYESSTNVEVFKEVSVERQLITPAGKSAALWSIGYNLNLLRSDQSQVGSTLAFDVDSFVQSEYPS